ncbi:hypothetical protein [Tenacibaculum amylolyticum]|uniref:hypothetical protein n=1 Tax=Tenacibaculum amylolyticum TaxID=104269 RepID=UPI0038955824
MKLYKLLLLLAIISCQGKEIKKDTSNITEKTELTSKNTHKNSTTESRKSILKYLKNQWLKDSSSYKPISWGILDTVNALKFKYKISHKYQTLGKSYYKNVAKDTLIIIDHTFTLDSNFNIISILNTQEYDKYYDSEGTPYQSYGNKELHKVGLENDYDIIRFSNNNNKLIIVGGDMMPLKLLGTTKKDWIKKSILGVKENLLQKTDTVEYCTDLIGEECFQYIFENKKLKEIKSLL